MVYKPRNPRQQRVRDIWPAVKVLVLTGAAGCGKTTAALAEALADVFAGRARKVYLSRPTVAADEEYGFLPGTLEEKFRPWLQPFQDVLGDVSETTLESLGEVVETVPVGMLRGRTFKHGTLIVDEAQGCTWKQILLAGSRFGQGGRVVLCGDPAQSDIEWHGEVPLIRAARRLTRMRAGAGEWVHFEPSDQLRDPAVTDFLDAMLD